MFSPFTERHPLFSCRVILIMYASPHILAASFKLNHTRWKHKFVHLFIGTHGINRLILVMMVSITLQNSLTHMCLCGFNVYIFFKISLCLSPSFSHLFNHYIPSLYALTSLCLHPRL